MTDLIKIEKIGFGNEEVNSVNARDVHSFLEVGTKFSDWIKDRLSDFCKCVDFLELKILTQYNQVDRIDYFLTLDTAKHICMMERNEKGKQLRQYFIDCEKKLKSQFLSSFKIPTTMAEALRLAADLSDENESLKIAVEKKHHLDTKTASAMGTASVANKKAKKAEEELAKIKEATKGYFKTQELLNSMVNEISEFYEKKPCIRGCKD